MKVYCGILHDSYPDENGKEIKYTDKIIAVKRKGSYACVSVPDFMTFDISPKDFKEKVTDVKEI